MKRLGILASHPIQYQAPLFRELARRFELDVYFAHRQGAADQARADFGVEFEWDVDLFSGYRHEFLPNVSRRPDVSRYAGCDTPAIVARIAAGGFDAFLVNGWYLKSYWQAIRECRRLGVSVMVRGDSTLGSRRGSRRRLIGSLARRLVVRQFAALLYVGQRNREYLLAAGARPERMVFSPHCVDNAWFRERARLDAPESRAWRDRWTGGVGNARILLFVGKLTATKRPADLLQAAALMRSRGTGAVAVFVGSGPLEGDLGELARALGVPAHFLGFRNQGALPALYAAADLLVLPSESETWGLVVNEAMACGLPVAVSEAVGCAPDLALPGETGECFAVGDRAGLAAAVERTLASAGERSPRVRERIDRYSVAAAASGVETALARALEKARER